jgi:hypothetical protein
MTLAGVDRMPTVRVTFDPDSGMSYIRLADQAKSGNAVR